MHKQFIKQTQKRQNRYNKQTKPITTIYIYIYVPTVYQTYTNTIQQICKI